MAKLPDTRQLQRNQPQYTGQVMNVPVAQDFGAMAGLANSVSKIAGVGADYAIQQEYQLQDGTRQWCSGRHATFLCQRQS